LVDTLTHIIITVLSNIPVHSAEHNKLLIHKRLMVTVYHRVTK